jgi:molecular chaperone DnaJ
MARDYYEVLGVSSNATDDEIKKAFRSLARECHPDANHGDPHAAERFKEINEAYETLRDPERRRRYDMYGPDAAAAGAGPFGEGPFGAGQFGLNDLFDAFFGGDVFGGGRGRGGAGPARGHDAETAMDLTLAEAVFGARRTVTLRMPVECDRCDGSGCAPGTHPSRCSTCGGTGEVRQVRRSLLGQIMTAAPCGTCGGAGQQILNPCEGCRGLGVVEGERSIDVEVPAGIDDGQRLRLAGRGPAAPRGGPAGDLFVGVRVAPHETLVRDGDELWRRLGVSIVQAALGTTVEIETLDGPHEVVVSAGTQHGSQLRVRGLGAPNLRSGRRGDLVVEVHVVVPTNLSVEEAEALGQYAVLRGEEVTPPAEGLFSRIRSAFRS